MCVILNIIKINELLGNYFKCNIYDMFLNGYCLEYYNILKLFYPDGVMVIEKNGQHCACKIDDNVYDVSGFCDKDNFYIANKDDLDFVCSFYNRFSDEVKNDVMKFIMDHKKVIKKG